MTVPHVIEEPFTRREVEIVTAWVRSGFALDGGDEERKEYALRIVAKLRGMWKRAMLSGGDDAPEGYRVPPSQSPETSRSSAELWHSMPDAPTIADDEWREYAGAIAACDTALAMGARHAAIVGGRGQTPTVRILPADTIGAEWQEIWRPPERKPGSPSRWSGNGSSRGSSRRSK